MDQFFSLPAALTATPSPLVALIGLDSNDRHSHLWRAFSAQSIVSHAQMTSQAQPGDWNCLLRVCVGVSGIGQPLMFRRNLNTFKFSVNTLIGYYI